LNGSTGFKNPVTGDRDSFQKALFFVVFSASILLLRKEEKLECRKVK
jgi:hypothetical protein